MNILNAISVALEPKASAASLTPITEPPLHAMMADLLRFAKLPDKGTGEKLAKMSLMFHSELATLTGYGQPDAVKERKALLAEAVAGKGDPKKLPTVDELIRRNSDVRRCIKGRASAVSREACLLAAEVFEQALAKCPEYVADLLGQERRIFPALALTGAKSPLADTCEQLPKFVAHHIKKLRGNPVPSVDPANLLKLN